MGEVVEIKSKEKPLEPMVVACHCGCSLFRLSYERGPVCIECDTEHPDWMDYD